MPSNITVTLRSILALIWVTSLASPKLNVKYGHFKATSSVVYHGTNLDVLL